MKGDFMNNLYVPTTDYACYVIYDKDTIRAYHTMPTHDSEVEYTDYLFTANYYERYGVQNFSRYSVLPTCLDKDILTTSFYYRNDFLEILLIFVLLAIICFACPLRVFFRFFKRFR